MQWFVHELWCRGNQGSREWLLDGPELPGLVVKQVEGKCRLPIKLQQRAHLAQPSL